MRGRILGGECDDVRVLPLRVSACVRVSLCVSVCMYVCLCFWLVCSLRMYSNILCIPCMGVTCRLCTPQKLTADQRDCLKIIYPHDVDGRSFMSKQKQFTFTVKLINEIGKAGGKK